MATLLEQNELASNPEFIARVKVAMVRTAVNLPIQTYATAQQLELGMDILAAPDMYAEGFALAVAGLPYIALDSTDELINYGVNSVFDAAAGSYEYVTDGGAVMPYPVAAVRGKNFKSAEAFSPIDIAGLEAWYDFSDTTTLFTDAGTTPVSSDGDLIYQANDKSGNSKNLTQATEGYRPRYKTNILNSLSVARFDGGNEYLSKASAGLTQKPVTFILAAKRAETGANINFALCGPTANGLAVPGRAGGAIRVDKSGVATIGTASTVTGTAYTIRCFTYGADNVWAWYKNAAAADGTGSENQTFTAGDFNLSHNAATSFNGDICEFLWYGAVLSSTDIGFLYSYLNGKWAVY